MDVLTWLLPLIVAIVTALGVWLGPQWAERRRRWKEVKEKIKRQILSLEDPFSEANEEDIERDWVAIGTDVSKTLKGSLKTAKNDLTKRTIVRTLYHLGDKEVRNALISLYEDSLKSSKDTDEIRETLEGIKYLKIVELAPQVFDRLKREKVQQFEVIQAIEELEYGPALPYLINLGAEHSKEGKSGDIILHACITALGKIAPSWNELSNEDFHRIIGIFMEALKIEDRWLTDAIVRCELPLILKCKQELREPIKTELIETLAKLLDHKDSDIRENAVERLTKLGDRRALPFLRKLLNQEKNSNTTLKTRLEWSLKVLEQ